MKSAETFEREYAERSGMTVERFREWLTVRRCECGDETCEGFAAVSLGTVTDWDRDAPLGGQVAGSVIPGRP